MSDFHKFAKTIDDRFKKLAKLGELFVVNADDIFETYLGAFPEGTNPLFKTRTEFDCSCCKNFVRNIGHVVSLEGNKINTVWDVKGLEYPFDVVAKTLNAYVLDKAIVSIFRTTESKFGAEKTLALIDGATRQWNHFYCDVPRDYKHAAPDAVRGQINTAAQVFKRGLEELRLTDLETVIDLIETNSLYRGTEFLRSVVEFRDMVKEYNLLNSDEARAIFVWNNVNSAASRFRNTVIGTLVQDLSTGVDLDRAVRGFETKVAPANYKRPTAVITEKMIKDALSKLKELGLESAIERRFASIEDVSVNNVLFVDNSVKAKMKDGLEGLLMTSVKPVQVDIKTAEKITMKDFMENVVGRVGKDRVSSIELLLENKHLNNFMSLTTAVDDNAGRLFKWDNHFAWSYDGDVTDSIKERVKRAGGNVDAALRVSLSWFNYDDLDLHVVEPSGRHIYYGDKGRNLDVDMNAGGGTSREAVENCVWTGKLVDGKYKVFVNNFSKRESIDVGFELELEYNGITSNYVYDKAVAPGANVNCLMLTISNGVLTNVEVGSGLVGGTTAQEKWGIITGTLVTLDTLMFSPNHWDEQEIGNKHWFFFLKDCKNPTQARGIYNEFLLGSLDPHRKVFEVLASKTKCAISDKQLSGVGFSSTRNDVATVVVKGERINKAYHIHF